MARKKRASSKSKSLAGSRSRKKQHSVAVRFACQSNAAIIELSYQLGSFIINLELDEDLVVQNTCYVDFYSSGSCDIKLQDSSNNVDNEPRCSGNYTVPFEILQTLQSIGVTIVISSELHPGDNVLKMYLVPSLLVNLGYASAPYINRYRKKMYKLLEFLFDIKFEEYEMNYQDEEEQLEKMYKCIKNSYDSECLKVMVLPDNLIPSLRPYQAQAVEWMLKQEKGTNTKNDNLHVLYEEVKLPDGQTLYFHKYGGYFVDCKYDPEEPCKGGILADEMGLGKTVEVLACILMNPRPDIPSKNEDCANEITKDSADGNDLPPRKKIKVSESSDEHTEFDWRGSNVDHFQCACGHPYDNDSSHVIQCIKCEVIQHAECILYDPDIYSDYICPHCWMDKCDMVISKATLIICPSTIIYQWQEEIEKHIEANSVKVFMYEGIQNQRFVNPNYLSDYDIVLISYETLKNELNHVNIPEGERGCSLRFDKKFLSIPSPLSKIQWWRICLDEAQMVESITTKVAKMVGNLTSINRWCVTGTPFKKSIEDLYGLFVFLGVKPYDEKQWWKEAILKPFINGNVDSVVSVLNDVAWRTIKENVEDQTGIPKAESLVHKLTLSPVEKIFYERQFVCCQEDFEEKIKVFEFDVKLRQISKNTLSNIMATLRKLQLSCCHCNIGGIEESQKVSSPSEVLQYLLSKTKTEATDFFRKYIMLMNGAAGICILGDNGIHVAIAMYEKILNEIEEHKKKDIRADDTQKIHACYNLKRIITKYPFVKSMYTALQLDSDIDEMSAHFVEKTKSNIDLCKSNLSLESNDVEKLIHEFQLKSPDLPTSVWWITVFEVTQDKEILINKLKEALKDAPGASLIRPRSLTDSTTRLTVLNIMLKVKEMVCSLHELRNMLREHVNQCTLELNTGDFNRAVKCHLRPGVKFLRKKMCKFCNADNVFKSYEAKLFQFEEVKDDGDEDHFKTQLRRGIHADGDLELIMKFFLNLIRHNTSGYITDKIREDATNEIKLFDALKKEFKALRNLWLATTQYVMRKDEIEMAKMSACLRAPGVPVDVPQDIIYTIDQLAPKFIQYNTDAMLEKKNLEKKFGTYQYLQNLEKAETKGASEELCPVCQQKIENTWALTRCGHKCCFQCMENLKRLYPRNATCPICREDISAGGIYYVDSNEQEGTMAVKVG